MSAIAASMLGATMILGNLLNMPTMRRGRKLAHQVVSVLHIASWVVISLAPSYEVLLTGRFIQGISYGLFMSISNIIIGEYTSPRYRGAFLASISLGQAVGVILVHVIGSFISWYHTALFFSFVPLISFIITIFLPDSPSWLALEKRYDDCRKAFEWLRGYEEEEELKKMIEARQTVNRIKKESFNETLMTLGKREVYISVVLGVLMYTISMVSGAVTIASFTNEVMAVLVSKDCNMAAWMVFCDVVRLIMSSIGLIIAEKIRRRTILYSSGAICVFVYLAQVGYIYAKNIGLIQEALWFPIVLLMLHIATIGLGVMLIPMMIIGEIYPLQYRSLCSSITNVYLVICMFTVLKTFQGMKVSIGLDGAYIVYAAVVGLALVASWFLLPETKGRTLQEIEEHFRGKPIVQPDEREMKPLNSTEQKEIS